MNQGKSYIGRRSIFAVVISLALALLIGCASSGSKTAPESSAADSSQIVKVQPMVIPKDVVCGKCGMYPANYPQWHTQIIFKDGTMTPFDGCKCMFNFMFSMARYDKVHSEEDVAAVFVKDFNTGEWLNAADAYFVVGSSMMGPMGKELIPFADKAAAMKFLYSQGGNMMMYADINPDVLKSLMGGMKMHGHGAKHMDM